MLRFAENKLKNNFTRLENSTLKNPIPNKNNFDLESNDEDALVFGFVSVDWLQKSGKNYLTDHCEITE